MEGGGNERTKIKLVYNFVKIRLSLDYLEREWLKVPIFGILLYICMSTMGLLSVPWTMTAEMYPMHVRGVMQGMSVCIAHVIMFGVIKSYYTLLAWLGGVAGLLLFYSAVCVVGLVFLYVFLPETHNKTLEEIADYFAHNSVYITRRKSLYDDRFPVKTVDDTENGHV